MIYSSPTGKQSPIPWTREEALEKGEPRYRMPEDKPRCGKLINLGPPGLPAMNEVPCACSAKYTETGECIECASRRMWAEAKADPNTPSSLEKALTLKADYVVTAAPCREGAHLRESHLHDTGESCYACQKMPPPRQVAMNEGKATYVPKIKCKKCLTKSPRHTETSKCIKCEQDRKASNEPEYLSPRQEALAKGETKFMPLDPCKKCHTVALRHVHNGRCDGCALMRKNQKHLAEGQPNEMTLDLMVTIPEGQTVDLETANVMGLNAFRPTGRDWLYIETLKVVRIAV